MDNDNLVLLTTIKDAVTDNYVLSILENEGIPYMLKSQGFGSYLKIYMGASYTGEGVYITEDNYEKGKKILGDLQINGHEEGFAPKSIAIAIAVLFILTFVVLVAMFGKGF